MLEAVVVKTFGESLCRSKLLTSSATSKTEVAEVLGKRDPELSRRSAESWGVGVLREAERFGSRQ